LEAWVPPSPPIPRPPPAEQMPLQTTSDPGNPFTYGIKWILGSASNATFGPDSAWTDAMKDSFVMEIARKALGDHLRAFCKQHPKTVNANSTSVPMPEDFRLGGELPKINRAFYITVVLPMGIITAPRETFIGSWSGGTIKTLAIDCCNHKAKIQVNGINRTGLSSLTQVPDGNDNYYPSVVSNKQSGTMRTVLQTFNWDEDVKF
jgi:hypothetical protein